MKSKKGAAMYGISRIDDDANRQHCWRVSIARRGEKLVRNFPDRRHGSRAKALELAEAYRDKLLTQYPPLTRQEYADTLRRHNKTGIVGVYRYAKTYRLRDGTVQECWYWEANWPTTQGNSKHVSFSVNRFGEMKARELAIQARQEGMKKVSGNYWVSERALRQSMQFDDSNA